MYSETIFKEKKILNNSNMIYGAHQRRLMANEIQSGKSPLLKPGNVEKLAHPQFCAHERLRVNKISNRKVKSNGPCSYQLYSQWCLKSNIPNL